MPYISMGPVYRDLKQLAENGGITEIAINGSPRRYDRKTEAHNHFECQGCMHVFDLDEFENKGLFDRIIRKNGFEVTSYYLAVIGLCDKCQVEEKVAVTA